MDRARLRANTRARRRGVRPQALRLARPRIGQELRAAFAETVARAERAVVAERGFLPIRFLPPLLRRPVSPHAIGRALVVHGLLHFTRRPLPLPIHPTTVDKRA